MFIARRDMGFEWFLENLVISRVSRPLLQRGDWRGQVPKDGRPDLRISGRTRTAPPRLPGHIPQALRPAACSLQSCSLAPPQKNSQFKPRRGRDKARLYCEAHGPPNPKPFPRTPISEILIHAPQTATRKSKTYTTGHRPQTQDPKNPKTLNPEPASRDRRKRMKSYSC